MNIVSSGSKYMVYDNMVKTYKELPVGSYEINFNKMSGYSLHSREDLKIGEEKIYGNHLSKVDKVLKSFEISERNFGVILSGQKGIGKTIFVRVLADEAIKHNLPVILVNQYTPGIAEFISSIEQEVVIVFDEFEKTFGYDDGFDPQEELLGLFDGIDAGKKLFIITCNELSRLNKYLLNRPGRFHYHFNITNPTASEVREYLMDKLKSEYHYLIDKVVNFSQTISITYDYLRAIVFELNQGYDLSEALEDLNITREDRVDYTVKIELSNGTFYSCRGIKFDIYSEDEEKFSFWCYKIGESDREHPDSEISVSFRNSDIVMNNGNFSIDVDKIKFRYDSERYCGYHTVEEKEAARKADSMIKVKSFSMFREISSNNRYSDIF